MKTATGPRLLGDIGGTHARFAWQAAPGEPLTDIATYWCAEHGSLALTLREYLEDHGKAAPPSCALGIANPVTGDVVTMTNHHWSFSVSALQREMGFERLVVINDFTALALALPLLPPDALQPLGGGPGDAGAPLAVIGAGTGLGVSGLLRVPGGPAVAINGEGGHVTLAAMDDREAEVIAVLRKRFGHVSAERVLSGPGLTNLHAALAELGGQAAAPLGPAEVIARAREAADPLCNEAIDLFCRFLGSAAGDLALTLGARGGVYIGGGIAPRLLPELRTSRLRERFEGKGRFAAYLAPIPVWVIDTPASPAFLGASIALDQAVATEGR